MHFYLYWLYIPRFCPSAVGNRILCVSLISDDSDGSTTTLHPTSVYSSNTALHFRLEGCSKHCVAFQRLGDMQKRWGGRKALLVLYPVVTELLTLWLHGVVVSGKAGSQVHRAVVFTLTVRWSRQPGTGSPLTMDTFVVRLIYPCPFVLMRDLTNTSYLQRWSNISERLLLLSSERNTVLSSKLFDFVWSFPLFTPYYSGPLYTNNITAFLVLTLIFRT